MTSADAAAYFTSRSNGLTSASERSEGGDPPGQGTPAIRLVFDGDPRHSPLRRLSRL
jgi:hypothetical protein